MDKSAELAKALTTIHRQFGKTAVIRLGGKSNPENHPAISSGSISLDMATGIGGYPRGRIIEIFGQESSGKTTLALHACANAQKEGGIAAVIDAEHSLDPGYAKKLGVNANSLLFSQPDDGEQALEICELLTRSNVVDLIVIDSVAALVPRAELAGDMGDAQIGLQARLMSQGLRKLAAAASKSRTCIMFLNQIRMNIGISWGNQEVTPGGRALKFYASMRLEIRKAGTLRENDKTTGIHASVKIIKNKMAPPYRQAEFDITFNEGICRQAELLDMATSKGIIQKNGSWFNYENTRIGQGRNGAVNFLKKNSYICQQIENNLLPQEDK